MKQHNTKSTPIKSAHEIYTTVQITSMFRHAQNMFLNLQRKHIPRACISCLAEQENYDYNTARNYNSMINFSEICISNFLYFNKNTKCGLYLFNDHYQIISFTRRWISLGTLAMRYFIFPKKCTTAIFILHKVLHT